MKIAASVDSPIQENHLDSMNVIDCILSTMNFFQEKEALGMVS